MKNTNLDKPELFISWDHKSKYANIVWYQNSQVKIDQLGKIVLPENFTPPVIINYIKSCPQKSITFQTPQLQVQNLLYGCFKVLNNFGSTTTLNDISTWLNQFT
eukprot:TRINITY_DN17094_c0_g1_i2.p2 TRINITY_DN17094_c0_g1~~TRINITY_DN17094_c0_g1_i2.p2  ORF type:complete len:104 (+),score=0.50 TRINITY_DN17094_c0_g1_i2:782-1093(+)